MEFTPISGSDGGFSGVTACRSGGVCVAGVDVAELSEEGLRGRLKEIGRAESRLGAMKSQVLAKLSQRHNAVTAERVAREELQSSKREARNAVETAGRLASLAETSEALGEGAIPVGHARLIARAASEGRIDESVVVEAAKREDFDQFSKTMRRHQQEMSDDDGMGLLENQQRRRAARAFLSRETGMFVMSGEFDPITGAHIDTVLAEKVKELWNAEDPKARRTPQQRMADALAELILEPKNGKAKRIALMLVADYDVVNQELVNARLADGSSIPMAELVRLACDADILPGVFRASTQEMNLGRKRRTASDAQRAALIYRDKECIGCGASAHRSFAHHVQFWSNGGPTDFGNLVLVCNDCHHSIHDHDWRVAQDPDTGRWRTKPPPDPFPDIGVDSARLGQRNPVLRR
ncbi:MAG: DUF222 domain-containing protein [Acidimicrobiia bacterium]|nr:DUF222 domain-containing protein [Acidimicrobiia bacterium]MYG59535.1 DUF222 domain-containing protein [Acidimicrobiia bacterium]MYJ31619.1 DUF222 domain-containing protein [Acidimicrobiia bacterium]